MTFWGFLFLLVWCAVPALAQERVREEAVVTVNGHHEIWRLISSGETGKICRPSDPDKAVCPCTGFEDADIGKFSVVRLEGGKEIDRMDLAPLFGEDFPMGSPGTAWLPPKPLLKLADYDRNGKPLQFLVQVDTAPCGKPVVAAIGISPTHPKLHALASAEHPDQPLEMSWAAWERLRKGPGPHSMVTWACGDHGAETMNRAVFSAADGVIHYTTEESDCP